MKLWSKYLIATELYNLHKKGVALRASNICSENSGLYSLIYYSHSGSKKYFGSLKDARESAALFAEQKKDYKSAEEIRKLNGTVSAANKMSEEELEQRRKELISELKSKIENGEDLSYRYQQKKNRCFVGKCTRAFGQYKQVFKAANVEYGDYARHINKTKQQHIEELIDYIISGRDLDMTSVNEFNPRLSGRLNHFYDGYYNALSYAKIVLEKTNRKYIADKIDVEYWKTKRRTELSEQSQQAVQEALSKIKTIDLNSEYSSDEINNLDFEGVLSGKEVYALLKKSSDWKPASQLAKELGCTSSNVFNILHNFADKVIKIQEGARVKYFIHCSAAQMYKRKNVSSGSPNNSINRLANELNVGYSKVRSISENLGLEFELSDSSRKNKIVSGRNREVLSEVVEREQNIIDEIRHSINPAQYYKMGELDIMGVPTTHLYWEIRRENIDYELVNGVRHIKGEDILHYFENNPNLRLSKTLNLFAHFYPDIYTTNELMKEIKLTRTAIRYRLSALIEDNPEICFRIRKSKSKSRVIATKEIIPFLHNWENRNDLQLINVFKASNSVTAKEVKSAIKSLEQFISDESASYKNQTERFKEIQLLKQYSSAPVNVGDIEIENRTLSLICHYMQTHSYSTLELRTSLSTPEVVSNLLISDVQGIVYQPQLIDNVLSTVNNAEWKIFQLNRPLMLHVLEKRNLDYNQLRKKGIDKDELESGLQDSLLRAVKTFDTSFNVKFSTYAYAAIKNEISSVISKRRLFQRSLSDTVGDDAELIDFIPGKDAVPEQQHSAAELNSKLADLLGSLSEKEREIIERRYGLNGREKETFDEIGKGLNTSKQRIQQIEAKIIQRLGTNPKAIKLRREFFD
jgi:RNA polymerase sigma factor (sigma-70 family)